MVNNILQFYKLSTLLSSEILQIFKILFHFYIKTLYLNINGQFLNF